MDNFKINDLTTELQGYIQTLQQLKQNTQTPSTTVNVGVPTGNPPPQTTPQQIDFTSPEAQKKIIMQALSQVNKNFSFFIKEFYDIDLDKALEDFQLFLEMQQEDLQTEKETKKQKMREKLNKKSTSVKDITFTDTNKIEFNEAEGES